MAKESDKTKPGETTTTGTTSEKDVTQKGGFNFQDIMESFYNYKPGEEDSEGRMMKNAFQGNFVQSILDSQLAGQLGQFNAGLAQQNMSHQADLEQRNQSALMKDEFGYSMQGMDAQFKYGEKGAQNQHERDLGMLGATGAEQRANITQQGTQDRLGIITQGEQDRVLANINNISSEKIASGRYDADKYTADASANSARDVATTQKESNLGTAQIGADAERDTAKTAADANRDVASTQKESALGTAQIGADADKFGATTAADASKYGADRTVDVANVNAKGTIDNTRATGDETRKTMGTENQLKAKDRADMHRYARSTARAM